MDEGTAKATLSNANLDVNVTYKSDESQTDGKVISQSIDQGKEVTEWSTVDIVVNKIEKKVKTVNLEVTVPESSKPKSNSNSTADDESVTVSVLVNGQSQVSEKTAKPGVTISCGTVSGTGTKEVKVQVNGKTFGNCTEDTVDVILDEFK